MTATSADLQWLVGLCRYDLGGGVPHFGGDVAPQAIVALARAHRIAVIAERSWRALAELSLAPEPPASLCDCATTARRRSLAAVAHLLRLAEAFERADICWVALKGPVLSMQLYGDPTIRTARDLDVIVTPDRLEDAVAAAEASGWTAVPIWRDLLRLTARYDMELKPTMSGQPLLELHRALAPRFVQFTLDPFARGMTAPVRVGGHALPGLTETAQATYVAWHGGRGSWYRLGWLVDYARLLVSRTDSADALLASAQASGAEVALRAGALLAQRLFAIVPPAWPAAAPAVARRTAQALSWSLERLDLGVEAPSVWSRPGSYRWLWREVAQQGAPWRSAIDAAIHLAAPTERDAVRLGIHLPLAVHRLARPYFTAERLVKDLRGVSR